ncbi:MlaD family protein [Desulfoluna spongiiphila]|uniref:Paraquat-inducible protein B n=1 Tax=Desulfoluna spongiiphila TaxID=419481 RepID=A0A1G5C438_9BACT|nr:MlaD family protein [Desulfoluna spongiiphila]SCX97087.1 paraquat-inducible protein B [Desulfoluna spongiiphila]VVS94099.1 mce/mlad [Desulfoluna spongiiphila]
MKQKAKLSIIGAFVVGGCLLASAMVVTFGAGEFFKDKDRFVLYFEDSLKGLDVGAPVRFMGVKVGNVTGIDLVFDMKNLSFCTPVHIEVDSDRIKLMDYGADTELILGSMDEDDFRTELVKRGLRAQLKIDSLLTGKLYVAIGFHPDKAYTLTGKSKDIDELPTVLSDISELSRTVENIPVEAIADRFLSTVDAIDRLIVSVEENDTFGNLNEAMGEFTGLMQEARKSIAPITTSIEGAAVETRTLAVNSGEGIQRTLKVLEEVAVSSQSMVETAEKTLESLDAGLGADSAVTYRLNRMLGDVSEAARALRALADYLERHPEALVFGKDKGK